MAEYDSARQRTTPYNCLDRFFVYSLSGRVNIYERTLRDVGVDGRHIRQERVQSQRIRLQIASERRVVVAVPVTVQAGFEQIVLSRAAGYEANGICQL